MCDLENCYEEFKIKYVEETKSILEYLTNERHLSGTHIKIMKKISEKINILQNNLACKTYCLF